MGWKMHDKPATIRRAALSPPVHYQMHDAPHSPLQSTTNCTTRRTVPSSPLPNARRARPLYAVPHNPYTNKKQQETTPRDNLLLLLTA